MAESVSDTRVGTINAVKTPLGFIVLGLLIVDGTIAALATALADYRAPLIWTLIISIPAFVVMVLGVALWRPEALRGDRPLQESHAQQLASDLFIALDGAFHNLEVIEREEAWLTVADVLASDSDADVTYRRFCTALSAKLARLANLSNRKAKTRGPVVSRG